MPDDDGKEIGRVLMWIGIGLLAVLLLGSPFSYYGDWSDDWGWFGGMMAMLFMFPIIIVVAIVALVVGLANSANRNPPAPVQQSTAAARNPETLAILERRYAAGEVDRAEYLRMRRDLSGRN